MNPIAKVLFLVVIVTALFLNATAFCYPEGRYLTDAELFESAVAFRSKNIGNYTSSDNPKSYVLAHPECCSMAEGQPSSNSILNLLLGYRIRYVRVMYPLSKAEIQQFPGAEPFYEAFVEVTPCGGSLHSKGISRRTLND